ncbi:proline reductase-associated electron transfer protein PrdC [Vagococcus zengguangii]|uniref:Proline reductase-associated electron transfer protein PrdC n=2 Tax=Vagococcus zengguangii TaxID=2571750 RepID=A0A4D7CTA6_9ENTE|nr:proline reductase-associated electron transfer protein PrdC [Vagococcus zengguangii]TLG81318.1 proline reductase-associated electron transfer protein PrdC [Vagococcus zengguangii]
MTICYIPLKQHVGAPCEAIVSINQEVKRGELIAKPNGLGANIHSSITGVVTSIDNEKIGITMTDVPTADYLPLTENSDKLAMIEAAGIVGAGGAGFPTHIKLNNKIPNGVFIVNDAECEALLHHNIQQTQKYATQIVEGTKHVMSITEAPKAVIAIKDKNRQAVIELLKATKDEPMIEVYRLPDIYPAGDERMIIREVLGIELNPGQLPIEVDVIVSNVETVKRISEAIDDRKPFIDKDVTVAGRVVGESHVFENTPIGFPVIDLIECAGGYIHPHGEIVMGGPMTGRSVEESTPINKTTGGILVAMPYPQETRPIGILICECGGSEERLTEIANNMGAEVVAKEMCKRMVEVNGRYRCSKPGVCPGQAEKVMKMKKAGAEVILTGTCSD